MRAGNRRMRLVAFAVITLVFIVSMTALIYWAVNTASARVIPGNASSFQAPKDNALATHPPNIPLIIENGITSQPF